MGSVGNKRTNNQRLRDEANTREERITTADRREAWNTAGRMVRQLASEGFFEGLSENNRRRNRRNG